MHTCDYIPHQKIIASCLDKERVVEVVVVVVVSLLPEVERVERDSSLTNRVMGPAPSMWRSSTMEVSELSEMSNVFHNLQELSNSLCV